MPQRYWNCISFLLLLVFPVHLASANAPISDGLAGSGRSGIAQESIFLNPAAIGYVQSAQAFFNFTKPRISDWSAGGRDFSLGVYDASSSVHSGLSYERESRARLISGRQTYADNSTVRFGFATALMDGFLAGITPRYITYRDGNKQNKFFTGDLGIAFNLFSDMHAGLTYENIVDKPGERPRTLAGGLNYALGYGLSMYGDYGAAMNGALKGNKIWSLGAEATIISDFIFRAGLYRDGIYQQRGFAWGLSWVGPRTGFHFALRATRYAPVQRDMTLGITLQL